jgi:hypothetical protein
MKVIPYSEEDRHSEGLVVKFEGYGIEQSSGNYLALIINPDYKFIEISLVRLTDKDLQGKNIYQELMNHMGLISLRDSPCEPVLNIIKPKRE